MDDDRKDVNPDPTSLDIPSLPKIRAYIASVNMRAHTKKATRMKLAAGPEVGIFWWYDGKLLADGISLRNAEAYGEYRIYGGNHSGLWEALGHTRQEPKGVEYDDVPRGRVAYDTRAQRFGIRADTRRSLHPGGQECAGSCEDRPAPPE